MTPSKCACEPRSSLCVTSLQTLDMHGDGRSALSRTTGRSSPRSRPCTRRKADDGSSHATSAPSIWETQEVYEHLVDLTLDTDYVADDDYDGATPGLLTPKACPASPAEPVPDCTFGGAAAECQAPKAGAASSSDPDAHKQRATVLQYGALIGEEVASHLEGLARARMEKHKRLYQTDQEIHEQYVKLATGGGEGAQDDGADEVGPDERGAAISSDTVFPMAPWNLDKE